MQKTALLVLVRATGWLAVSYHVSHRPIAVSRVRAVGCLRTRTATCDRSVSQYHSLERVSQRPSTQPYRTTVAVAVAGRPPGPGLRQRGCNAEARRGTRGYSLGQHVLVASWCVLVAVRACAGTPAARGGLYAHPLPTAPKKPFIASIASICNLMARVLGNGWGGQDIVLIYRDGC